MLRIVSLILALAAGFTLGCSGGQDTRTANTGGKNLPVQSGSNAPQGQKITLPSG